MVDLDLIIHNVRSAYNVGSILRSAEGLGVKKVYLTGYTPHLEYKNDTRLPHIVSRVSARISKTSLGAEKNINWQYFSDINDCLASLRERGFLIVALEQTPQAINIGDFKSSQDIALVVGNETAGLDPKTLEQVDRHIQIPMAGSKESFNVSVAAAIAIYHLRYISPNRHLDKSKA